MNQDHILSVEAQHIQNLIESDGWKIVEQKVRDRILDLQNINNIDEANLAVDLKARIMASKLLFDWLKSDVYGAVEQASAAVTPKPSEDSIILRE